MESTDARVSPLLGVPGAVAGSGDEAAVAAHYGDLAGEQRALAAGTALVDRSHLGVVTVAGPDRLSWLDSLTSQRLTTLPPGGSAETLLLDPSGRIEHAAAVLDDGTTTYLVLDRAHAAAFATFLDRMRFMLRVEVADGSDEWAVLGSFGEPLVEPASPAGVPLVWRDPWTTGAAGGVTAAHEPHPGADWRLVLELVPRAALADVADSVRAGGVRVAGLDALEALRIAAWRPRLDREVDERSIPHELDWLRSAVHLAKGCYRGQETVAKVHNLGRPPRRLVQLDLDGSENLAVRPGDAVLLDGTAVGSVTSAALHHEAGPIALAVVKRSTPGDAVLVVETSDGPVAAAQQVVVPPGAGPAVAVPRLPRLGAVR